MKEVKIIVKVIVPELDETYDVEIPITRKIGNVIELLSKAITELNEHNFDIKKTRCLYDKNSGIRYDFNKLIYDTNIRNYSEIVLL